MIITILSISILILLISNILLLNRNIKLSDYISKNSKELENDRKKLENSKKELDDIKKWTINQKDSLFNVSVGDTGIIPEYGLVMTGANDVKTNFTVTYEVEILEVSVSKFKVKAVNFTSSHSIANDPTNRKGILEFLEIKSPWIDKNKVELVVDDRKRRSDKLNTLLDE